MHFSRSNGAVHDRDATPAAPPATKCCHQNGAQSVRHRLMVAVLSDSDSSATARIWKQANINYHRTLN